MVVATDGRADAEPGLDGADGRSVAVVVRVDQPDEPEREHRGVDVVRAVRRSERTNRRVPAVGEHVVGDGGAQRLPLGPVATENLGGNVERAIDGQPAHRLGVDVVARGRSDLPDPLICFLPAVLDRAHQILDQAPVPRRERRSGPAQLADERQDGPEDVELDLVVGGVADAHRPTPPVPR
jgi:hypothetical protein